MSDTDGNSISPLDIILTIQLDLLQVAQITAALSIVRGVTCCEGHRKVTLETLDEGLKDFSEYHEEIQQLLQVFRRLQKAGDEVLKLKESEAAFKSAEASSPTPPSTNLH